MRSSAKHLISLLCVIALAVLLVGAAASGWEAAQNAYLSKGFHRTTVHILAQEILELGPLVAALGLAVAAVSALAYKFTSRGNAVLPLALGLTPAGVFFLRVGYNLNRLRFSEDWHAGHDFLGTKLPRALFVPGVWAANAAVLAGALAIALCVWLGARRLLGGERSLLRRFWLGASHPVALAVALCLVLAPPLASRALKNGARGKPNFVLISLDALRYDHLGCYGYPRETSPRMDRLAREGIKFEWAISQAPTTLPSHMSTLTSLYPTVHGCRMGIRLPARRLTLAEYLRDRGYSTAGCVDGGYMRAWYGFDQGFEIYDDRYKGFASAVREVLHWIDIGKTKSPFFVLMHTYDIHSPYDPPEPYKSMFTDPDYDGRFDPTSEELRRVRKRVDTNPSAGHGLRDEDVRFIIDRYDGGIRYVDEWIGKLVDGLDERGLLDNTWLVITADHGEEFTEHGVVLHGKLYLTVARVPLIVLPPRGFLSTRQGQPVSEPAQGLAASSVTAPAAEAPAGAAAGRPMPEGRVVTEIVELLDLAPTFLELAGIAPVDTLEGQSMVRLMGGDATGWINLGFSEHHEGGRRRSVVTKTLHAITSLDRRELEVYDYHADPLEQHPLADSTRADEIREIEKILWKWIADQARLAAISGSGSQAEIDEKALEELRTLGYVD